MNIVYIFYAPRKKSGEHIVAALFVRQSVSSSVRTSHSCPAHNLLFKVGFQNHFTEMATMLRRHTWVPTFKVKVTAVYCSKMVSGPLLCYLKSEFENIS